MSMSSIIFITGGERSGKSSFAQKLALEKSDSPVYLATARVLDDEFALRVERHKKDRDQCWRTIEEPMKLSYHKLSGEVVILDCITLWLANIFYSHDKEVEVSLKYSKNEWNKFIRQDIALIAVSNELGMGVHGQTSETRRFTELHGWMNQYVAQMAQEAYLMVSGIPLKLK